jgi:hypothetical protein
MRRAAVVVLLFLFGSGPLVAQAEAAESLALSIAELAHPSVIEPTDSPAGPADLSVTSYRAERLPVPVASKVGSLPPPHPVFPWNAPACAAERRMIDVFCPVVPGNSCQASLQVFRL